MKNYIRKTVFSLLVITIPVAVVARDIRVERVERFDRFDPNKDPLGNLHSSRRDGDYLVDDGKLRVVIGASSRPLCVSPVNYVAENTMGSIIGVSLEGADRWSDTSIGEPLIWIGEKRKYVHYKEVELLKGSSKGGRVQFVARGLYEGDQGEKLNVRTTFAFRPGSGEIDVVTRIRNTGDMEISKIAYSMRAGFKPMYSFSPFHRKHHPGLNFIAYPNEGYAVGWLDLNPPREIEEEPKPGRLRTGEDYTLRYRLVMRDNTTELLESIYKKYRQKTLPATLRFDNASGTQFEIIIRDALTSAVFFRDLQKDASRIEVPVPEGVYRAEIRTGAGANREKLFVVKKGSENTCEFEDSAGGSIRVSIADSKGVYVPGKVTLIGLGQTPNPYFLSSDPITNARWGSRLSNSRFPRIDGSNIPLPVGTYLVSASRGPEYSRDQEILEVLENETTVLNFTIDKVIDTVGLVSIDPHMHTTYSDGRVTVEERIRSVVAEGVDVAIATDHNILIDYAPVVEDLGLEDQLKTIIGNEVTVSDLIHFNSYPLTIRGDEINNGAVSALSDKARALFDATRKKDPGAIIQVNHPRLDTLGYFSHLEVDPDTSVSARKDFSLSFDLLETVNGPLPNAPTNKATLNDWMNLINQGNFRPLVGSSDSHSIDGDEPGYSRTYVYFSGDKGKHMDTNGVLDALKAGRSFLSNSPIVELRVRKKYFPGDTLTARDGKVIVNLKVRSAPWVVPDEVAVLINGERKLVYSVKAAAHSTLKFRRNILLNLDKDASIIAEVTGKRSLYPVVQRTSGEGLLDEAVTPYALTNPIFVDVDGNGVFDPPLLGRSKN